MAEKPEGAVVVISSHQSHNHIKQYKLKYIFFITFILLSFIGFAQTTASGTSQDYKKRVLETAEVDFLSSFYSQNGDNAAVTGGIGSEELTDVTGTFIISIPLSDDDVLTIDTGVSAYTSASSSNVDPFDGSNAADPFVASTGASKADTWFNFTGAYTHSSDSRNDIWSAKISVSTEYDYFSLGFGGGYTKLFNEKNTELSINANVYLDKWNAIYPIELRPFDTDGIGFFRPTEITGSAGYNPNFSSFENEGRNSYSLGLVASQILHKNVQGSLSLDVVQQQGLLSTPFQRVYFNDVADSFIEGFQLADDIERLPDSRFKIAVGGRLNWYLNEFISMRTYYRYYFDDWGINSHTASIEVPIKLSDKFTLYPSYRFYNQTMADYFAPHESHLSTEEFYTSDYDLSKYRADQYGFGISYTDIFTKLHVLKFGLKSVDMKYYYYNRNSPFHYGIVSIGFKFVIF